MIYFLTYFLAHEEKSLVSVCWVKLSHLQRGRLLVGRCRMWSWLVGFPHRPRWSSARCSRICSTLTWIHQQTAGTALCCACEWGREQWVRWRVYKPASKHAHLSSSRYGKRAGGIHGNATELWPLCLILWDRVVLSGFISAWRYQWKACLWK